MTRSVLTCCAILFITSCFAQSRWAKTGRWLQRHDMELSMGVMAGVSYFEYSTKAIEPHFITPELSLDLLVSQRVAQNWFIHTGIIASYKGTREPLYDYPSNIIMHLDEWTYSLRELDYAASRSAHGSWAVPFKVSYYPGRLGLTLGAFGRHFSGSSDPNPVDFLHGRFDAGAIAGLGLPLGNYSIGVEYFHGLVNVQLQGMSTVGVGPQKAEYKAFNRSAQLSVRYTFHKLNRKSGPPEPPIFR